MNAEKERLKNSIWKKWGPYVSNRQWGTVREDYSENGEPWTYTTHDKSRSIAYRWGEEGIAGISDDQQLLCLALSFWNRKDPIIKETFFGLTNNEGNHGEDIKEIFFYLDGTPTHSYMKMVYKYPINEFPYKWLVDENGKRTREEEEFEIFDTGIFNEGKYFDVFIEYAKGDDIDDILIKLSIENRSGADAEIHVLPTVWFRNTWSWGYNDLKPKIEATNDGNLAIYHEILNDFTLYPDGQPEFLFCENETNNSRLYGTENKSKGCKDAINDYLVYGKNDHLNEDNYGTKAGLNYRLVVKPNEPQIIRLRLKKGKNHTGVFEDFDNVISQRIAEADEFYSEIQNGIKCEDEKNIQRQAFAGMLWNKQFYYYDVDQWLKGDPGQPPPPPSHKRGRNHEWLHLNNADIISMPDKWEYPWYAAWDLAFHCIPLAVLDAEFAKNQLLLLTKEWYMHPNGQLPAYEWALSDVNPPVHAWATWEVFKMDEIKNGQPDTRFLESIYHKLLLNFTWWVNRKDTSGNNIFEGGFLGLDNIGVFDRNATLPTGNHIEQADGSSWMAMFSLNMMRISLELARKNPVYQDMATKFFEHFLYIAGAMASMGNNEAGLWDEQDEFYYDVLRCSVKGGTKLRVRSLVGLIPLFAVEVLEDKIFEEVPEFALRLKWFLDYRPDLASLVSRWKEKNEGEKHLLSLLRGHRMKKLLERMLDPGEFLSDFGVRSLSKYHEENPYSLTLDGDEFRVNYTPGEAETGMFGGNSNWRGPIWMPVNYMIVENLKLFYVYYGPDFKVECPTGSGNFISLLEISEELERRLCNLFKKDENGRRPALNNNELFQNDEHFKDYLLFHEYFHGDTGKGLGAMHQTGWTGLVAMLLMPGDENLERRC